MLTKPKVPRRMPAYDRGSLSSSVSISTRVCNETSILKKWRIHLRKNLSNFYGFLFPLLLLPPVHSLNVAESTADFVVWVRVKWTDPRLAWNPEEFDGLKYTWCFVSDGMGGARPRKFGRPICICGTKRNP